MPLHIGSSEYILYWGNVKLIVLNVSVQLSLTPIIEISYFPEVTLERIMLSSVISISALSIPSPDMSYKNAEGSLYDKYILYVLVSLSKVYDTLYLSSILLK